MDASVSRLRSRFDDPNLVSCAGFGSVLGLAERAGLQQLVARHVHLGDQGGINAHLKVPCLVAGMIAGADSIDEMALLRHGGTRRLFTGVRAPSTLRTFLRTFTFGHVRQLDAVASRLLVNLTGLAPLLVGADELAYVDVDDTVRQTYGYVKQGAGRGYTGTKGLNALLAIVSTPALAPLIAAARLRKGSTHSSKGAARLVADALVTAKGAGACGVRVLRADSAFYRSEVIAAALRHDSCFSITARQHPASARRSRRSTSRRGRRSNTPTPSSTKPASSGSPTRKSPRFRTPHSLPEPGPNTSPPGSSRTPGRAPTAAAAPPESVPSAVTFADEALVAAYTVAHGRDGRPVEGLAVLDTVEGRTLARIRAADLLVDAESRELVGQRVAVTTHGSVSEIRW